MNLENFATAVRVYWKTLVVVIVDVDVVGVVVVDVVGDVRRGQRSWSSHPGGAPLGLSSCSRNHIVAAE